jgi:hypothetical protein
MPFEVEVLGIVGVLLPYPKSGKAVTLDTASI